MITFSVNGMESEDIGFILWKAYRIVVRTGLHCSPLIHERINAAGGSPDQPFLYEHDGRM